jgi:HEPN domain-containing protein
MSDYDKYEYWLEGSEYDIETAKVMHRTRRYLYVGFMCHQSVEKALKAVFVRDYPPENLPYTHNLEKIAESSAIYGKMSESQKRFLEELVPLNIESRYPETRAKLAVSLTTTYCKNLIARTEEFIKWLITI